MIEGFKNNKGQLARPAILAALLSMTALSLLDSGMANAATLASQFAAKGSKSLDHSAFDALLKRHVVPGADGINRVNYRNFLKDRDKLARYIDAMQAVSVPSLSPEAAKAYWINLYNAKTVDVVLAHYPVQSIRDIRLGGGFLAKGPWKKTLLTVGGTPLSLDNIEHDIARKIWKDPRLHYGFNCASIGCPNLATEAYRGVSIEAQLDEAARAFINHPRGVTVSKKGLTVSKIYSWYKSDFGTRKQLFAHWKTYATGPLEAKLQNDLTIKAYDYDWSLNEVR